MTNQKVFDEIINIIAHVAYEDVCMDDNPHMGHVLEVVEAYLNEGTTQLGERTRLRINTLMYELLLKPAKQRMLEIAEEQ